MVYSTTRNAPYIHPSHYSILELWRTFLNESSCDSTHVCIKCVLDYINIPYKFHRIPASQSRFITKVLNLLGQLTYLDWLFYARHNTDLFVCVDVLHPGQQFFIHVRTFFGLLWSVIVVFPDSVTF